MNRELMEAIDDRYFRDEYGNQLSGHPDELAVSRDTVIHDFPETAEWPIEEETRSGCGYVLVDGVYLFPSGNTAEKSHFDSIVTVD